MRRLILEDPLARSALWSRNLALFAVLVAGITLAIARFDRIDRLAVLGALLAAAAIALVAMLVALWAFRVIWRDGRRGFGAAVAGLLIASAFVAYPAYLFVLGRTLPTLNDVTTDPATPPEFSRSREALAARRGRTPPDPPPATRDAQRDAYPGIAPIIFERSAEEAHDIASQAVRDMGWRIIETVPPGGRAGAGRIDAIAQTLLLRFSDDITIRIRPQANGARIDVRSASRIGRHDFGSNARRLLEFARRLHALDEEK